MDRAGRPASGLGPIVRKTEEEVVLLSVSNQGPNVTRTSPQFPLPNRRLTLHGSNLAEGQEVVLPTGQGEVRLFPIEAADDQLTILVPQDFQDGEIGVETSNFSSNRILVKTFFAPVLEATFVSEATGQASESGVEFLLRQDMEQFPLERFELQVPGRPDLARRGRQANCPRLYPLVDASVVVLAVLALAYCRFLM